MQGEGVLASQGRAIAHLTPGACPLTHRDQATHSSCVEQVWGAGGGPGAAKLCDPGQVTHLLWASVFLSGV